MDRNKVLMTQRLSNLELGDKAKRTRWAAEGLYQLEKPLKALPNVIPGSCISRFCCNLQRQKLCFLGEVQHASTDSAEEVKRKLKLTAPDLRLRVNSDEVRQLRIFKLLPRSKYVVI
jgi:hypothetical protein